MREAMIALGVLLAVGLVGAGVYGFVYDLKMWGVPMILGLVVAGNINNRIVFE